MHQPSTQARAMTGSEQWNHLHPERSRLSGLERIWNRVLSRVIPGAFFLVLLILKATDLATFARSAAERKAAMGMLAFSASFVYQTLLIGFLGLVVVLFVIRSEPIRKAEGFRARLVSQSGAFILTAVAMMPKQSLGWGIDVAASLLLMIGMVITVLALMHLGRCFSIMPEVRGAVMTGPYRLVRHPMYLGEFVSGLGMALATLSVLSVTVYLVFVWLQCCRMDYEERGLRSVFPRYDLHITNTKRLIPWVY
ncbi:MAG: isoprenylcysteine carboxylmethyltransferase family protein [Acidobacteria bacterium]|nr:isoprenylcysteine carboxylmethyltransferase family protein [Acidobacteriota bacterium]